MDSKLWKLSILASVSVLALILVLVIGLNREPKAKKPVQTNPVNTELSQTTVSGQVGNDLSAFLRDDNFFDAQTNPYLEAAKEELPGLSLIVTSVQKDLRVRIVDEQGELVTGESFFVKLDSQGEYKDLDQDGIVYIGDLKAGEVKVSLLPIEGYRIPKEPVSIKIKERVEYVPIDDILLLIKNESEIDVLSEDTEVLEAVEETDQPEVEEMVEVASGTKAGIDVSKWQKEIDWEKVKHAGVDFAIIRAGYRGSKTGALVEDPYFKDNLKGAKAAGVEVGIYFFTQAISEVEAVEEASMVIALCKDWEIDFPVFIDTEGAGGNGRADGLDVDTRTLVCDAFCRTVKNAGFEAGVYASRNWYDHCLDTKQLEDYFIWLAEYRDVPIYKGKYQMWQYSSKGKVDGIAGNVDLNIRYY